MGYGEGPVSRDVHCLKEPRTEGWVPQMGWGLGPTSQSQFFNLTSQGSILVLPSTPTFHSVHLELSLVGGGVGNNGYV